MIDAGRGRQAAVRLGAGWVLAATQVATVEQARAAADRGVDVIVARGGEGGGRGEDAVATLPLLQEVLEAVNGFTARWVDREDEMTLEAGAGGQIAEAQRHGDFDVAGIIAGQGVGALELLTRRW